MTRLLPPCLALLTLFAVAGRAAAQAPAPAPTAAPSESAQAAPMPLAESLTGMARAEYAAARILYEDGDYQGALQKLRSAFEMSKDARLLWNMAAAEKNLRHYAQALGLVERYVKEGGTLVSAEDRAGADAFVETIRGFVADVTVEVNQPEATILIDDVPIGLSPLTGPVKVDMGVHKVRVQKPGFVEFALTQDFAGGRGVGITAQLVEERHEGRLRVVAGSQDAIQVDGKVVGAGMWEGVLPSGPHVVYVTGKGKNPYQTDALVRDNDVSTVHVTLQNEAKATLIVQKEGVPAWIWITGGVLLAGGAGVGAYFIFKPDEPGFRPAEQGNWGAIDL